MLVDCFEFRQQLIRLLTEGSAVLDAHLVAVESLLVEDVLDLVVFDAWQLVQVVTEHDVFRVLAAFVGH